MAQQAWKVIVVNPPPDPDFAYEHRALYELGVKLEPVAVADDEELLAAAADADVVVPIGFALSARVIGGLERCRLIPMLDVGLENVDVAAATARGILVTGLGDLLTEEVADHAWMLLLLAARRGLWLDEMVTSGRWQEARDMLLPDLTLAMPRVAWRTLGLVAFGKVARAVARRAQGFGVHCVACDPYVAPEVFEEHRAEQASLESVCRRGDFISCHLPLTAETTRLIGGAQFDLMKSGAIFVNTGHGKTVDEAALIAALEDGRILAAGLDVLEREPPDPDNPLLRMPNVALSPHVASVSTASYVGRHRFVGEQIANALRGRVPAGVVNPEALADWRYRAAAENA